MHDYVLKGETPPQCPLASPKRRFRTQQRLANWGNFGLEGEHGSNRGVRVGWFGPPDGNFGPERESARLTGGIGDPILQTAHF
jgi:hypothetical protein